VILTLPSEQDANRKLTGELKQFIPTVLETVDELEQTAARQARNLTPTQSYERAAVLGRRLFEQVNASQAAKVAEAYTAYYVEQRDAGVQLDSCAFEPSYLEQIRVGYPFHPELIRLFAEQLAAWCLAHPAPGMRILCVPEPGMATASRVGTQGCLAITWADAPAHLGIEATEEILATFNGELADRHPPTARAEGPKAKVFRRRKAFAS
jgi:hypothetical protein